MWACSALTNPGDLVVIVSGRTQPVRVFDPVAATLNPAVGCAEWVEIPAPSSASGAVDPAMLAEVFGWGFGVVMASWLTAMVVGTVIRLLRQM